MSLVREASAVDKENDVRICTLGFISNGIPLTKSEVTFV